jgi:citrate lyase subunit beta/citryl-CoA lyase
MSVAPAGVGPPIRGEAGRAGEGVRSDLHVTVEPAAVLEIEVRSRVASLYGEAISETIRETLEALAVAGARVTVDDQGALPWVIAARVEAAVRAAGLGRADTDATGTRACRPAPRPGHTDRERLRRSRLYLPGNEPKFMLNAGLHRPDGVILDLEDSVHPSAKPGARILVRNALRCVDFRAAERMVRINQLPLGLEDLDAVVPESPDMVLIPKVEGADQVVAVADRIREIREKRADAAGRRARPPDTAASGGGPEGGVWLMPILESALGIENAVEIAGADESVVALTIGLEDYTADLGVTKTAAGSESLWARRRLVNAARAMGVQAIDSVYGDVDDLSGLLDWGRAARAMGFTGMGCVHPRQIRVIHDAFAPSPAEVERAERIVAAFREAESRGLGVVSLGSKMIDPPVVERARRLVEDARRVGLTGGGEA